MENKHIYILDAVMIFGTILILAGAGLYAQPLLIAPLEDSVTSETQVLFSIERGNFLLIDDSPEFTSPDKVYIENELVMTLKPGVYYWKVDGVKDSEIRKLVIESKINLEFNDTGKSYEIVNRGNIATNVTFYANDSILTSRIIDVRESVKVIGDKAEGGQAE